MLQWELKNLIKYFILKYLNSITYNFKLCNNYRMTGSSNCSRLCPYKSIKYGLVLLVGFSIHAAQCQSVNFTGSPRWVLGTEKQKSASIGYGDIDQDGDIDLFVSNGDLNPNCVPMYNFYFENNEGLYTEQSSKVGLKDYGVGRGSVVFDLENDGDMDLLVVSQKPIRPYGPPSVTRLYKNESTVGNYLQVKLKGNASTPSAFGARIEVYSDSLYINHEIDGGNTSHISHNSRTAHFCLGAREKIDSLKVTWPGGVNQTLYQLVPNQRVEIEEELSPFKKTSEWSYKMVFRLLLFSLIFLILTYRSSLLPY